MTFWITCRVVVMTRRLGSCHHETILPSLETMEGSWAQWTL